MVEGCVRVAAGTPARSRLMRALNLWYVEALTERRTTEWTADAETWPEAIPVVGVPRLRRLW